MLGLCPKCWNKRNNMNIEEERFYLTGKVRICKECGRVTPVVRSKYDFDYQSNIWYLQDIEDLLDGVLFLFLIPYVIYRRIRYKKSQRKQQ